MKSRHPLYSTWASMIRRCECEADPNYVRYGGRGITVCDRWRNSFEAFVEDVGPKPTKSHSLDRFPDGSGNYEPENVRWATPREQARNKRNYRIEAPTSDEMKRTHFYLTDFQVVELKSVAKRQGISFAEVIRRAIDWYFEEDNSSGGCHTVEEEPVSGSQSAATEGEEPQ